MQYIVQENQGFLLEFYLKKINFKNKYKNIVKKKEKTVIYRIISV